MERHDDYEPMNLNLQKSQGIRQPKLYFLIFILSAAMFGILVIFAAVYFRYALQAVQKPSEPETTVVAQPSPIPVVPTATPTTATPVDAPAATGWLTVHSSPEHAAVTIDGTVLGHTPLQNYELKPGSYTVSFAHNGQSFHQTITIEAGKTTEMSHRFHGFGSLNIRTTSSGSTITINGKPAGQSPLLLEGLAPGTYTIVASKVGYATAEQTISLKKGEHRDVFITIKRLRSAPLSPFHPTPRPSSPLHPSERLQQ